MVYVKNNGVHDLSFVEEAYMSAIFSDGILVSAGILVNTVEELSSAWETAKNNKDVVILRLFRGVHHKARAFLDETAFKIRIKDCGRRRDADILKTDYCDLLLSAIRFARLHPGSAATEYVNESFLPGMMGLADQMEF
jgi:hypothetical protein